MTKRQEEIACCSLSVIHITEPEAIVSQSVIFTGLTEEAINAKIVEEHCRNSMDDLEGKFGLSTDCTESGSNGVTMNIFHYTKRSIGAWCG